MRLCKDLAAGPISIQTREVEATQHRGRVRVRVRRRRRPELSRRAWLSIGFAAAAAVAAVVVGLVHSAWRQGQGLAHVDGVEITQEDLFAEARSRKVSATVAAPALLDAVIARELLAQEARRRKLERRADYPSDRRRAVEQTLASALLAQLPAPAQPSQGDLEAYIARRPEAFAQRRRIIVEAVSFASIADPLSSGVSWDDLMRRLQTSRLPHREDAYVFTTGDAPAPLRAALPTAVVGRLISVSGGGFVTVYRVDAVEPAPLSGQAAIIDARIAIEHEARELQVAHFIEALSRSHRVRRTHAL